MSTSPLRILELMLCGEGGVVLQSNNFSYRSHKKEKKKRFISKCRHLANLKRLIQEERENPKSNVLFRNFKNEDFKEI